MFNVNAVSIESRQLRQRKQVRNTRGTFKRHGGNNIIPTEAQELAVYRFCHEKWEMGIAATPAIIFAAISHLPQAEQQDPTSQVWFQQWLKKNPSLHIIKTKPITRARIMTHTEEDLKPFFVNYQNALSKYNTDKAKCIYNMNECGVRIGCSAGEVVIVSTEVKELYTSSSENRQSVTIIEAICADGHTPPSSVIICSGEKIMKSWIHEKLTGAEVITVSPTEYTNENIELAWFNHFIKHVETESNKHWRIFPLNGHSSYWQNDFIIKCHENHIVPFKFPSHMTHVLQPPDVGFFRPW